MPSKENTKKVSPAVTPAIIFPPEKSAEIEKELSFVREEMLGNKYIWEMYKAFQAGALRSAIGSYWNAVTDDLRRKILHRSVDLFNKEMQLKHTIKKYEDFQDHVTEHDLIEGAYKVGVITWEGRKILHQARENRNIYDGHPDSSDPTFLKVLNFIADCNKYVLSQDYPVPIIDTNEFIVMMDSNSFHKSEIAVKQAFSDLPAIYQKEMLNKFFTMYLQDNISTTLRSSIEFCAPILWEYSSKEDRKVIGERFDKELVKGNKDTYDKAIDFLAMVDGFRYVSKASRTIVYERPIAELDQNIDNWHEAGEIVTHLQWLGFVLPEDLIERYVSALTRTYIGYSGYYSFAASPHIPYMFKHFDNKAVEAFINVVQTNHDLHSRIKGDSRPLQRLRSLATVLLEVKPRKDLAEYLELILDNSRVKQFFASLKK
jgi:hypothetical protein